MKILEGKQIYTVSEINSLTRRTLEKMAFWVEGEISSLSISDRYRYIYLDLKDPDTGYKLPCILEPDIFDSLNLLPENGMKVLVSGNLTLWEKEAKLQLYIHSIEKFGEGKLLAQLEKLKAKLQARGYFDESHKKKLPPYPDSIAVITSKDADAWQDFKTHSIDKFPLINFEFFDVLVQGPDSKEQIVKSIRKADQEHFDAIVIIRGGGSQEDLAAFNDEQVAAAIYAAKTPIVVGVGHEKDITIVQLVADIAASTPTDAAKIISADFANLQNLLSQYLPRLKRAADYFLSGNSQSLDLIFHKLALTIEKFREVASYLQHLKQRLKQAQKVLFNKNSQELAQILTKVENSAQQFFEKNQKDLKTLSEKISILSPKRTLARGYSITKDAKNHIVKNAQTVAVGDEVKVQFAHGRITSKILERETSID